MLATVDRPGVWRRAGFNGAMSGLELTEAMATLPAGCDREFARELFVIAEAGYLRGHLRSKDQGDKGNA